MTSNKNDIIQKRLFILSALENYISESIYYRSYNDQMKTDKKYIIWNYYQENGKTTIL